MVEISRQQKIEWKKRQDDGIEAYRRALNDPQSEHYAYVAKMPYKLCDYEAAEYLRHMPWMPEAFDQVSDDQEMLERFLEEVITPCDLIEVVEGGGFVGRDAKDTVPSAEEIRKRQAPWGES